MKYLLVFVIILFQTMAWSETKKDYDFSNRTPGSNIFAYEGISGSQIPTNNSFPSSQYSASSYSDIASNNNRYHDYINYSKNQYPSIRYVVKIDEDANAINKLNIFWNGYGVNSKRNQTDGVRIYIWNNSSNDYDFVTQNTNDWVDELDQDITSNIANYVDNSNQITIYVVSQKKTFNRGSNWIGTDYFRLSVTYDDTQVPATAIANFQFDECAYTGVGNEAIDQTGSFSSRVFGISNSSNDAVVNRSLDLSATGIDDWVGLSNEAIDGLNDFSISTWIKTAKVKSQQEIFQALGSSVNDDELEIYLINSSTVNVKIRDNGQQLSAGSNITDGQWHHLVLTRKDSRVCLYVDGAEASCNNGFTSGALSVPNNDAIVIGQEQDGYHSNFDSDQSFEGYIDEFIIYDGKLTATEVSTLYGRQSTGKNHDGTLREADQCDNELIAQFSMETLSWNDVSGEVVDETGRVNARAKNGATTANSAPALVGDPGTCRYGTFDGNNDYIELPSNFENLQDSFTVTAWINPTNLDSGSRIFADDEKNQGGYALSLSDQNNGNGHLRFYSRSVRPVSLDSPRNTISANTWHFVAMVHNKANKTRQIYAIEQSDTSSNYLRASGTYSGNWGTDSGPATIGGETDNGESNNRFTGNIDEVHVFKGALSATEIEKVRKKTHPCAALAIHHYEIVHDGNGLTCAAEPVTIKACTNSDCSSLSTESVSLDFITTGAISGQSTKFSPTFAGSTSFNFNHTTAEALTLSVNNATVNASNPVECSGAGSSCDMRFDDAGYLLTLDDHNSCSTPNLVIQAVKLSDNGVSCAPAYTGNQQIDFTFNYNAPSKGSLLPLLAGSDMASAGVAQRRTVGFDANAKAELPFQYNDAGQISVNVDDASTLNLAQGSVTTIVTPAKLIVQALELGSSCSSADPDDLSCTKFKKAGENFNIEISATCDDTSIKTSNFKLNNIALTHQLVAPINKNLGTLGSNSANISNNGVVEITDQSISEVGVFTITATPPINGYFGKTIAPAISENIGRFIPDHFTVTSVFEGELINSNGNSFVYTGEMSIPLLVDGAINYKNLMEPEILISARNSSDIITQNYTDNFMRLIDTSFNVLSPTSDSIKNGKDNANKTDILSDIHILNSNLSDQLNGTIKYKFSDTDNFAYTRNENSLIDKYTADIDLQISSIIDKDGVSANDTDGDANNGIIVLNPVGIDIRFGRWNIENTYGPETIDLPLPMSAQYWDGSQFVTNTLDNVTPYDGTDSGNYRKNNDDLSPKLNTGVVTVSDAGPSFKLGLGQLLLSKPSDGSQGQIRIIYNDVPSWLKFNWDAVDNGSDGNIFDDNPSGVATFGLYRGNDRIISWREVTN